MFRLSHVTILLAAVWILTACGKKQSSSLAVIPASSTIVVAMQMDQLSEKMNFNEVKSRTPLGFLGGLLSMQGIPNFIDDRTVTGINFEQPIYLFMTEGKQLAMAFQVDDEGKMRTFLSALNKERPIQDGNGFNYSDIGQVAIGWSNATGLLVMGSDETDPIDLLDQLFHLSADSSMATTGTMASLDAGGSDLAVRVELSMLKEWTDNPLLQDRDGTLQLSLSFDNGEVVVNSLLEGDEELMNTISSLVKPDMDNALLQVIPDAETPAAIAMRFNSAQISSLLQQAGIFDMVNEELGDNGTNTESFSETDKLLAALTGEMVVALTNMDVTQEGSDPVKVQPHWYLAAGVTDEVAIQQLMDSMVAKGTVTAENGYWANVDSELGILVLRDGMLLITSYPGYYQALINGGEGQTNQSLQRAINKYPLYASANLQTLGNMLRATLEAIDNSDTDDVMPFVVQLSEIMDRIEVMALEPTGKGWEGKVVLYLTNDDENSLSVLSISLIGLFLNSGMLPI